MSTYILYLSMWAESRSEIFQYEGGFRTEATIVAGRVKYPVQVKHWAQMTKSTSGYLEPIISTYPICKKKLRGAPRLLLGNERV